MLILARDFVWFQVFGVSFSPNGYHLASGGEDNSCRIWDLRKRKCLYIIPAHSNLISQVKYEPQEGYFLVTGSYDTTAKVFHILYLLCSGISPLWPFPLFANRVNL